ncbi:hypothetical protein O0L34_g15433 [Tuta absoluta]|nr:hypothetical protein O0L34_g15433 [Tuta absoluta]
MPHDMTHDIASIREWLAKEDYLPEDFSDMMIRKFLHSCYGSLERTKKCIERFATTRSTMPEIYTSRDVMKPNLQTAFSITAITTYEADGNEILIHELNDPGLEKFNFYDLMKTFGIQADYWLRHHPVFPEGHIIILDIKEYTLKVIPKVNIMLFRDYLLFLLEGMPVRVKEVHVVNCPSFVDKLYALVKPILPEDIRNIIRFHQTTEILHKYVNKKYLPIEFGGEAQSTAEQQKHWISMIEEQREWYLNDNTWKADLKKKPKNSVQNSMNGSFRTLSID